MLSKLAIPFSFATLVLIGVYRVDPGDDQIIDDAALCIQHESIACRTHCLLFSVVGT